LDDSLAEAHTSEAAILLWFEKDWTGTEREFKRAIELNPGYATAHHWYGYLLSGMGLHQQAIAEIRRAQTLDPLSPRINASFGRLLYRARRYDEAIHEMRKALDLNPEDAYPHLQLSMAYSDKGMHEQAIAEGQKAFEGGRLPQADLWLARALALAGKRQEARKIIERALQSKQRYVAPLPLALAYVALGEKNLAFSALERVYVERSIELVYLRVEPGLDPLRSDPRFQDLLRRMNFPP
jgi:tetratricopeptide (TPR) repeat protein